MRRTAMLFLTLLVTGGLATAGAQGQQGGGPGGPPGRGRMDGVPGQGRMDGPGRPGMMGGPMGRRGRGGPGGPMGRGGMDPAAMVLNHRATLQLDSSQVTALTALQTRFRQQMLAQRQRMDSLRRQPMVPADQRTPAQQEAVRAQRRAMAEAMLALGDQRDAYAVAVRNTLTESQRTRWTALREDMRRTFANRGPRGQRPPMPPAPHQGMPGRPPV